MKRAIEIAGQDANALFGESIGRSLVPVLSADEAKAFSFYHTEYSFLKAATKKKTVAKEAIIASASSALEAAMLLKQRATQDEAAPQIGE
jgi:hypothetical protein